MWGFGGRSRAECARGWGPGRILVDEDPVGFAAGGEGVGGAVRVWDEAVVGFGFGEGGAGGEA